MTRGTLVEDDPYTTPDWDDDVPAVDEPIEDPDAGHDDLEPEQPTDDS